MDFFVQGRNSSPQAHDDSQIGETFELDLLAIAKKIGLSFSELNELRVSDLFTMAEIYTGADKDKPREATQADIDAFFGR